MKRLVIIAVKCILAENGKILFIKEPAGNSWRPGSWSLPGGKIDPDENYIDAIKREVFEETGLKVRIRGILKIVEIIRHIKKDVRLVHHYVAVVEKKSGKLKKPDHYMAEYAWLSKNEIIRMPINNLSEFYYKDVIKEYFRSPRKLIPTSFISILSTNKNMGFKKWSSL